MARTNGEKSEMQSQPGETAERRAFYERIDKKNLTPLWTVLSGLITPEPRSACSPTLWRFDEVREALVEAGGLITAKEAERRVLVLENAGMRGQSRATTSLYAGVQMVLPNEVAPAHRHTQSALRFVLDGAGAYTTVSGEKTVMNYGDFVITPNWAWHDHGNETDEPMFWLDGLDLAIVSLLDASFAESYPEDTHPVTRSQGQSYAEFGHNMLPMEAGRTQTSPIFNYPYAPARDALDRMQRQGDIDVCHGYKLRYINPTTGESAMPTIGTFLQLLPKGFASAPYRSTDATVFACVEGRGETRVGDEVMTWGPRDIFVVPSWRSVVHVAAEDSVLFSYSDRPVQEKLGLFRESRSNG